MFYRYEAMEKYRPDYVVHGETGYLVKSDIELSQSLGLLLSDQDLRLKMSRLPPSMPCNSTGTKLLRIGKRCLWRRPENVRWVIERL